jgi:hypothetical protein
MIITAPTDLLDDDSLARCYPRAMAGIVFYDSNGSPVAYCDDGVHIYLFDGQPVAYFDRGQVYSFSGAHLGWFENSWLYDGSGNPALFSDGATGGPLKPIKQIKPIKGIKQIKPIKGIKQIAPIRPILSLSWSRGPFFDVD